MLHHTQLMIKGTLIFISNLGNTEIGAEVENLEDSLVLIARKHRYSAFKNMPVVGVEFIYTKGKVSQKITLTDEIC